MASTVLPAYLLLALTTVSAIPLISDSIDHPLVPFYHHFYSFSNVQCSISQWLTVCCGIKTAPNWKCFSPQGGLDPTSGQGSWPQGSAALAWTRTMHKSSTGKKKSQYHQLCWMLCIQIWLTVKLLLLCTQGNLLTISQNLPLYESFISLFNSSTLLVLTF